VDVYKKTIASDGVAGLYRGFVISCVGIIVYRGLYFGMYDSLKPVVLTGNLAVGASRQRQLLLQDQLSFTCCLHVLPIS